MCCQCQKQCCCHSKSSCCQSTSCGCESQCSSKHHSCCSQSSCGSKCGSQQNSCCGSKCDSQSSCSSSQGTCSVQGHSGYAAKFLELADLAWMEVLKEKIKQHIESENKHMDELAKLISDANHERWKKKMEGGSCKSNFEEQLKQFFHQSCPKE